MDSENRRLCRWWKTADLIRQMKTENGVETTPFEAFPHHFFAVSQISKIMPSSVQPSTPESESLFRLS